MTDPLSEIPEASISEESNNLGLQKSSDPLPEMSEASSSVEPSKSESPCKISPNPCSREMWAYIIIAIVVICICFNIMRMGSSGPLPNGTPSFIDNEAIIYIITTVSILMNAYSTFLTTSSALSTNVMNISNILFGVQVTFLILWFYYYYNRAYYKTAFGMCVGLSITSILQLIWTYKNTGGISLYGMIPSALLTAAITWATWKSSR